MATGQMRDLFAFDRRLQVDDGYGNMQSGDFEEVFRTAAGTVPLKGTETVMAARLTGVQPWTITVRCYKSTLEVDTSWRARDVRTGTIFDITTVVTRNRRDYIDMTCVSGKAS